MRSNRRLSDHVKIISKYNISTDPPPADALFWTLWNAGGEQVARQSLQTGFLNGIQNGNLDPTRYGAFNVSDIYYCHSGARDYVIAAERTTDPVLKDYFLHKHQSYEKYNKSAFATWNLTGPESLAPTETALKYSEFERAVAKGTFGTGDVSDPIFTLIVMLPCEFLWAWLASQIAPPKPGNLYGDWITGNNDPHGAYAMGNFLQDYVAKHPIDEKLAIDVYLTAMQFEYMNFNTATAS